MRHVHRTLVARILATLLLILAVSPVTAPFTTIELSDFAHHEHHRSPANLPHPGHQAAVPIAKVLVQALTDVPAVMTPMAPPPVESRHVPEAVTVRLQVRSVLQAVLRV